MKPAPMLRSVHHINFLVRDLEQAVRQWQAQLGVGPFRHDALEGRAVRTARIQVGETWIVLVQPVAEGEPMRILREQGEGLFLLSFGVEDLEEATAHVHEGGGELTSAEARQGLDGWRVIDVDPRYLSGGQVQLCKDS